MQEWYNNTNTNQRILMFVVSVGMIPLFMTGLIPLVILLYLHFGSKTR